MTLVDLSKPLPSTDVTNQKTFGFLQQDYKKQNSIFNSVLNNKGIKLIALPIYNNYRE